jgi:tetratricopeptide (TPR) repeat protein
MILSRSRTPYVLGLAFVLAFAGTSSASIGLTALENAVHKGDVKKVEELLDKGADVNEFKYGTALMIAAQEGRLEIARLLIARKADINIQSNIGWSALGLAADAGYTDMVDFLIAKGADVDGAIAGIRKWAAWTAGPPVSSPSKAQKILQATGVVQARAGFAYYSSGQYEKSLAVFQARVKEIPNDVQNWLGLAFSSAALKKYDDAKAAAIANFRKASDLAPDDQVLLRNVMHTCGRSGDFDGAIAAGDRLLTKLPVKDSVEVLGYRSTLYRQKGMPAQAADLTCKWEFLLERAKGEARQR